MEHADYMKTLAEQKKLILGGPFTDSSGGMVILEVNNIQEANDIARKDPAVRSQVFQVQVHPWFVAFEQKRQ